MPPYSMIFQALMSQKQLSINMTCLGNPTIWLLRPGGPSKKAHDTHNSLKQPTKYVIKHHNYLIND